MFFEWNQNSSGGSFVVNDKVTHRVVIEADSYQEAEQKAFDLGIYYNGCNIDYDCSCCGDRWYEGDEVEVPETYVIPTYLNVDLSDYTVLEEKEAKYSSGGGHTDQVVKVDSLEQYFELLALIYGWCDPDCRVFYKDGSVKEIGKGR